MEIWQFCMKELVFLHERASILEEENTGINPEGIIKDLQSVRLAIDWENKERGRRVYDDRIEAAVINAGESLLRHLELDAETYVRRNTESVYSCKEGIIALADFYGGDPKTEEGQARINGHKQKAAGVWQEEETSMLEIYLDGIQETATRDFDPRTTPGHVDRAVDNLNELVERYQFDPNGVKSDVDGIVKNMHKRAYEELLPETLSAIRQPPSVILEEIAGKPPLGEIVSQDGKYDQLAVGEAENSETVLVPPQKTLWAPRDAHLPGAPEFKLATSGENPDARRYGLTGKTIETIAGPTTLYAAESTDERPGDGSGSIINDIATVFEYGKKAGIGNAELRQAKQSMLEANDLRAQKVTGLPEMLRLDANDDYNLRRGELLLDSSERINRAIENSGPTGEYLGSGVAAETGRTVGDVMDATRGTLSRFVARLRPNKKLKT